MFASKKLAWAVRYAVYGLTAASTLTLSANAEEALESQVAQKAERIEVTGSRIKRVDMEQSAPVLTIDADSIVRSGFTDLGTILANIPAIGATDTLMGNNQNNELAGISSPDLRRLGANRTLVLVNGKRHVAAVPGSAQVDISTIPASLVKRVEVLTGGASAVYGSDAVSGVVNVILKNDYEGLAIKAKTMNSTEGVGNKSNTISVLAGADFSNGRGNVTFYSGFERTAEVMSADIRQFDDWGVVNNPANKKEDDGIPDMLRMPRVYSAQISKTGVINPRDKHKDDKRWVFDYSGKPVLQAEPQFTNGAFGNFPNGCEYCFKLDEYQNMLPDVDKVTVASTLKFDITDDIGFSSDFRYSHSSIEQQFQPSFSFNGLTIDVENNPYLDAGLRQMLLSDGRKSVNFSKFFDEIGNRSAANDRNLFRYTATLEGVFDLSETAIDYEFYYVYGETRNTKRTNNNIIEGNLYAAIDAVKDPTSGEIVCRSQVKALQGDDYTNPATLNPTACVPYNPFGLNQNSAEAAEWLSATVTREDKINQNFFGVNFSTDSGELFELPGGPVAIAMGYEHRKETSKATTDSLTQSGVILGGAATPDAYGEFDVNEFYSEILLPILSDLPGADRLELEAAFRRADYSHAGQSDAWKLGLMYAPVAGLTIRATSSTAVRAPSIAEAFDPLTPGFAHVDDPCDVSRINNDSDRAANCAALGLPANFAASDNVSVQVFSGGNPNLKPETSKSLTVGVIWEPQFIEGFSTTLDYYDIEIEDAIIDVKAQDIADNCVDAAGSPDSQYCKLIKRNAQHNIDKITSGYRNAAALNTKGVQVDLRYSSSLEGLGLPGELAFSAVIDKLLKLERFEFQNRPDEINVETGEIGDPKIQVSTRVTYQLEDFVASWSMRHVDRVATYDVSPNGESLEDLYPGWVPSMTTHDVTFGYNFSDAVSLNLGIINLFDKLPPGYVTNPMYDVFGRRAFLGIDMSL